MTISREFLELALSGESLTEAHLVDLVNHHVKEDEFIDFKSGALLANKTAKDAQRTMREYMSGFANSDGGVLIFGIEDVDSRADKLTGCSPADVGGDLAGWATRCLTNIAAYFSPAPKFVEVAITSSAVVLVCAVARSYNLVPVIESGRMAYYLRLGDQTLRAPDYLVADFLLGRRARPILEVMNWAVDNCMSERDNSEVHKFWLRFELQLQLANSGLVWAEQSRWGLVMECIDYHATPIPPNSYLHTLIDFDPIETREGKIWTLGKHIHRSDNISLEKPFDSSWATIHVLTPFVYQGELLPFQWKAALYITAKNSAPIWYQIVLSVDSELKDLLSYYPIEKSRGLPRDWPGFSITRLYGERPMVGWIRET